MFIRIELCSRLQGNSVCTYCGLIIVAVPFDGLKTDGGTAGVDPGAAKGGTQAYNDLHHFSQFSCFCVDKAEKV